MSRILRLIPSIDDADMRAYRQWQQRAEEGDAKDAPDQRELIIQNGDPECEAAIAALEQQWAKDSR